MDLSSLHVLLDPLIPQKLSAPLPSCGEDFPQPDCVWARSLPHASSWCTVCSIKEQVGNCLKWLQLFPPLRLQQTSISSQPTRLRTTNLFICWYWESWFISLIILVICFSVWSQDMSSGKENGEENELGHTLIKHWCAVRDKLTLKAKTEQRPWQIQPSSSGMNTGGKSTTEFEKMCRRLMEENEKVH